MMAAQQTGGLESLDQRRQGARIELEQLAQVLDRNGRELPQGKHHEVLRMRQPERLENGPINRDDGPRGNGQGETDLLVQRQQIGLGVRGVRHTQS